MDYSHTETNASEELTLPKLVRDRIPEIMWENDGMVPTFRALESDEEFQTYLLEKVAEEALELKHTRTAQHLAEEIADIMEVLRPYYD